MTAMPTKSWMAMARLIEAGRRMTQPLSLCVANSPEPGQREVDQPRPGAGYDDQDAPRRRDDVKTARVVGQPGDTTGDILDGHGARTGVRRLFALGDGLQVRAEIGGDEAGAEGGDVDAFAPHLSLIH